MNAEKAGIMSTTSPEICRRTTSRNLNVLLHSYSFVSAITTYISDLLG